MPKYAFAKYFTASTLVLLMGSNSFAQEETAQDTTTTEETKLETVKIEDHEDVVVSGQYLEEKQARDLRDAFKDSPEVAVGGAQRTGQKVYVRGLEDTNLNVTVDGARQAGYLFHHQTRLNVDPELLKQVNVEAGTGNALAGPGALGGAIRFVTKDAEDLLLPGENWGALIKGWYHTNNDEKGDTIALFGKPTEKISTLGYITLTDSIDYAAGGGGRIPYSGGSPKSAMAKVSYRANEEHKVTVGSNFTTDNATRLVRANFGYTTGAPVMDRKFETLNTTLNYDYTPTDSNHAVRLDAYNANNKLQSSGTNGTTATFDSYGVAATDTLENVAWKLTYGADANKDTARAKRQAFENTETGDILGVFAQGQYNFTNRLRLGAGVRYDHYKLTSVGGAEMSDAHFSPNANIGYQWNTAWSSKLSWTQAFRGPTPVEVFLLAGATSVAPVTNLKGTVAETAQFSNKIALSGISTVFDIAVFNTVLHDPLESSVNRTTGVITRRNLTDDLKVQGVEAKVRKTFGDVSGQVFYTHSETKFGANDMGYTGNFTRGVSLGDRAGLGIEWQVPDRRLVLNWNSTFVMKLTNVPTGALEQPGYDVHDVSATWFATHRLRASIAANNIFDKKYVAQGSWFANASGVETALYEPGRDFKFALSYQF